MRLCAAAALALCMLSYAPFASAWALPEHAALTDDGLARLPPAARRVFAALVADVQRVGLALCRNRADGDPARFEDIYESRSAMSVAPARAACVPLAALPAFAGDHARTPSCLARAAALRGRTALDDDCKEVLFADRILGIAVQEWVEAQPDADRDGGSVTDVQRDMDVRFALLDVEYLVRAAESNAHFAAAEHGLELQVAQASAGGVNHALAHMLRHHLRSLQLAVRARALRGAARLDLRARALLAHAFALHFMQDVFAAGHLSVELDFRGEPAVKKQRHDYYNQHGLGVTRATARRTCREPEVLAEGTASRCWVAYGDGYLARDPGADDRRNAADAVARIQAQFALALDDTWVRSALDESRAVERPELIRLAELLDPIPPWTAVRGQERQRMLDAVRARAVLAGALLAAVDLERLPAVPGLASNVRETPFVLAPDWVQGALDPCVPAVPEDRIADPGAPALCNGDDRPHVALGTPAVSLVRPLLAVWPTSQAAVETLDGQASFGFGASYHALLSLAAGPALAGPGALLAAPGALAGVAFRADNVFSGRDNRSLGELNVGLAAPVLAGGGAGVEANGTAFAELRLPALWLAVVSLARFGGYFDRALAFAANDLYAVSGVRFYASLDPDWPWYRGWDLEALTFILPGLDPPRSASIASQVPMELRLRIGEQRLVRENDRVFSVALELTGGLSAFF